MIPVPMLGFKALNQRLGIQRQMTEAHQNRMDVIQQEIRKLQVIQILYFMAFRQNFSVFNEPQV